MLDNLFTAVDILWSFATPVTLFNIGWATLLGIVIGALPGLTATMGLALLTTLTYSLDDNQALLVLICLYVGAIYGGSRTAILLNIPGTPANAATTLDGFPLAKRGEAGEAMVLATMSSAMGTLVGVFFLIMLAPMLADFALSFGSFEYFWLGIFGVVVSGRMTAAKEPVKGWIAGFLGLFLAMIGQESIHAYNRFTFGYAELAGGIGLIPAMVGAFGFAEILTVMKNREAVLATSRIRWTLPHLGDLWQNRRNILRSGVIGTAVGIIPGVGEDIGAWVSYAAARRASKHKDAFGNGSHEGLIAAETGNNAAIPGAMIPAMTLGIPGSGPAAILLAAMYIHNVRAGPMIMIHSPEFVYQVFWMVGFATVAMMVFGLLLTQPLLLLLRVPRERLMPVIFVLCVVGSYAIAQRGFDIGVMFVLGIIGFFLREMRYPMAPLILGLILGTIVDQNLRRALMLASEDWTMFFVRPPSAVLVFLIVSTLAFSIPGTGRAVTNIAARVRRRRKC